MLITENQSKKNNFEMKSFYVQAKACYCFQNVFISQSFLILIVIKKLVLVKETVDMKMLSSCQTVRDLRLKRGFFVIFDSLLVSYSLFVVKTIAKIPRCKIHSLLVTRYSLQNSLVTRYKRNFLLLLLSLLLALVT